MHFAQRRKGRKEGHLRVKSRHRSEVTPDFPSGFLFGRTIGMGPFAFSASLRETGFALVSIAMSSQ